jgi:hypothetical protein
MVFLHSVRQGSRSVCGRLGHLKRKGKYATMSCYHVIGQLPKLACIGRLCRHRYTLLAGTHTCAGSTDTAFARGCTPCLNIVSATLWCR